MGTCPSDTLPGTISFIPQLKAGKKIARNAFLAKLDARGVPLWAHAVEPNNTMGLGVAEDAQGNVLGVLQSTDALLVTKLDSSGKTIFTANVGALQSHSVIGGVESMVLDAHGDMLITGNGFGKFSVGSKHVDFSQNFAAKISGKDGAALWVSPIPTTNIDFARGRSVVVDASGDAFVAVVDSTTNYIQRLSGGDGTVKWASPLNPPSLFGGSFLRMVTLALAPDGTLKLLATVGAAVSGAGVERGTYLATLDTAKGAVLSVSRVDELGDEVDGGESYSFGEPRMAIGQKGEIAIETSFWSALATSEGKVTSKGWDDILVVTLPPR